MFSNKYKVQYMIIINVLQFSSMWNKFNKIGNMVKIEINKVYQFLCKYTTILRLVQKINYSSVSTINAEKLAYIRIRRNNARSCAYVHCKYVDFSAFM